MTIGTAIFLASLIFGALTLFRITKDRWNWEKIMKRAAYGLIGVTVLAGAGLGCYKLYLASAESERVKLAEQQARQAAEQEKQAEAKIIEEKEKEKRARFCIANDIPRLESVLKTIQSTVKSGMSLEEAKVAVDKISGLDGHIIPPTGDIKERVLIYSMSTPCDSPFYFLVNVRAGQDGALRWLHVLAKNPPAGYAEGIHTDFSSEFEQSRVWNSLELGAPTSTESRPKTYADPCAADLSRDERLKRLAAFGKVRQTGERDYLAGGHAVSFYFDWTLMRCE